MTGLKTILLAGMAATAINAIAGEAVSSLKLLSIGNSFSWSAATYLPAVAKSAGCEMVFEQASLGGWSLQGHWELAEKSEADPTFQPYGDDRSGKFSLREKLESRDWDIVTIQQASHFSWQPETFTPYAAKLAAYIHCYAPNAEIVLQQTWSYRPGEPRLEQWQLDSNGMYERLTAGYVATAGQLKLRLIPTGLAVQLVRLSAIGSYPELEIISADSFHLSKSGEYLQACVWFAFLFNRPAGEIRFRPAELPADQARFLQKCAQAAIDAMPQHNAR